MKKKKIILSFDYELFFGDKSGTVLKTLIEPTNKILDAMDSVGFKGNFFIDWQMLKYLKAENTERTLSDYNLIKNQLKDMVRRGHRPQAQVASAPRGCHSPRGWPPHILKSRDIAY